MAGCPAYVPGSKHSHSHDPMTDRPIQSESPAWSRRWLRAAGIYNLLWGGAVVAFPGAMFTWAGMEPMRYPQVWQCVGMIVGVYGVGYLIAARAPRVHWLIVLVGLLGKILGPIGFGVALAAGVFTPAFSITILTNDIIWWIPFAMILWDAARSRGEPPAGAQPSIDAALDGITNQHNATLRSVSDAQPVLCVLTRHSGCTFCREMLADLQDRQSEIQARGYHIGIMTMSDPAGNDEMMREYGLESASWFSDPDRVAYRAFDLQRGTFLQLFGPGVLLRGIRAALRGHGIGPLGGDGFQMPGAFVISRGRIVRSFRHRSAADRPDFEAMACEIPR